MNDEYISIAEFAKRAGVSRQAIYKRLDGDLSTFIYNDNGKKTLSIRALSFFVNENDNTVYSSELCATLKKSNEFLLKELDFKNSEIEVLRNENLELTKKLIELSEKVGGALATVTQTQFADKMIEGKKLIEEQEAAAVPEKKKKWFWQK